jgi:hypothetical protein
MGSFEDPRPEKNVYFVQKLPDSIFDSSFNAQ